MVADDKLETFQEDTIRLFNAAKTFERKFSETSKNLVDQVKPTKKVNQKKRFLSDTKKRQQKTVGFSPETFSFFQSF